MHDRLFVILPFYCGAKYITEASSNVYKFESYRIIWHLASPKQTAA